MTSGEQRQKAMGITSENPLSPDPVARGSGISLWRQIAQDLEADILSARLAPGDRLPTETDLASRYAVNRHTLRRAISELTRKGLVVATPRLGTFVTRSRLAYPISSGTRFSEIVAGAGREPGGRLISTTEVVVPAEIATLMGLPQGSRVVQLDTVRIANEMPICLSTSWFPADRFRKVGALFAETSSITRSLKKLGVESYRRKASRISARPANSEERTTLSLEAGATVLVVEALNVDDAGVVVHATRARFAADRVELVVET